jgi:putative oxidoreductase
MSIASIELPHAPRRTGAWALQAIVATVFFAAGAAKLGGTPYMVQLFSQIGLGQWFRIVTGVVEIIGAIALIFPRLASIGGLWLGATMFAAIMAHIFALHTNPAPALIVGLFNLWIVYLRRDELASIARTIRDER